MKQLARLKGAKHWNDGFTAAEKAKEIFDAVCDAFEKCVTIWQASTMVTNILGTGPVPTCVPG